MRIRIIALASVLLFSHAQATDQLIKLPKPGDLDGAVKGKIAPAPAQPPAADAVKPQASEASKPQPAAAIKPPAESPADPAAVKPAGPESAVASPVPAPVAAVKPDPAVKNGADLKQKIAASDVEAAKAKAETAGKPPARRTTAAEDDEEQNIQLLAQRISARLAALRSKSQNAKPPAPPVKSRAPAVVRASLPAAATVQQHWHYDGDSGPGHWGKLNPAWAKCDSGQRQSPIDIRDGLRVDLEPINFEYKPARFNVLDNGHTVQVNVSTGNAMILTGRSYELVQFHFHLPSEERINGKGYPMVLHMLHKDLAGRLAMVAVLIEEGTTHQAVQQVWNNLPLEKNDPVVATASLDLARLLPSRREYFTYMGSLTTPPCSEGVLWVVMKEPIQLSSQQIAIFSRLYPMNARPIQAQAGRLIKESN